MFFFIFLSLYFGNINYDNAPKARERDSLVPGVFDSGIYGEPRHTQKKHFGNTSEGCDQAGKLIFFYNKNVKFPAKMSNSDKLEIEKAIADKEIRCVDFIIEIISVSDGYYRTGRKTYEEFSKNAKELYYAVYSSVGHHFLFVKTNDGAWVFIGGFLWRLPGHSVRNIDVYALEQEELTQTANTLFFNYGEKPITPLIALNENNKTEIETLILDAVKLTNKQKIDIYNITDDLYFFLHIPPDYFKRSLFEAFHPYSFVSYQTSMGHFLFLKNKENPWVLLRKD